MVVNLVASMVSQSPLTRFLIDGTKGSFIKRGLDPQEARLKSTGLEAVLKGGLGTEQESQHGIFYTGSNEYKIATIDGSYASFFGNVADAITKQDPLLLVVKPDQARIVIRLIELCAISAEKRQSVEYTIE